jgi:hypothetical protein
LRKSADGACGLLFSAAKRSGAFPLNIPTGLRARASRLGGPRVFETEFTQGREFCTAGTCSPHRSGVAAIAEVDVNQQRAKANTTGSTGLSCEPENRRLSGGRIGVATGGRRDRGDNQGNKAPPGRKSGSNGTKSHFEICFNPLRAREGRWVLALLM